MPGELVAKNFNSIAPALGTQRGQSDTLCAGSAIMDDSSLVSVVG